MQVVGAFDAKTHFSALLQQVEQGKEITITKHGHPIAKLIPISTTHRNQIKETILRLKAFGQQNKLGLPWKDLRDEGRR